MARKIWTVPAVVLALTLMGCSGQEPEDEEPGPAAETSPETEDSPAEVEEAEADKDAEANGDEDEDAGEEPEEEPTEDPANPDELPEVTPPGTQLAYGEAMIVQRPVGVTELDEGWAYLEYTVTDVVDGDASIIEEMADAEEYQGGSVVYVNGTITVLAKYGLGIDGIVGGTIGVVQSDGVGGAWPFGGQTYEDCTGNFLVEGAEVGETVETCHIGLLSPDTSIAAVMYYGDGTVPAGQDSDNEYWDDPVTWQ